MEEYWGGAGTTDHPEKGRIHPLLSAIYVGANFNEMQWAVKHAC